MRIRLDAWLERKDPRVRLLDADSGRELLRLGSEQVRELMESGDLCPGDLENDSRCSEVITLLQKQIVSRRDPTRLRAPAYMGLSKLDLQPVGNLPLPGWTCHV